MFMGFDGKLTLHPNQVTSVHKAFTPTAEEVQEAKDIVALFDSAQNTKGALTYKNKMVDLPHYTRSKKVLLRAGDDAAAERGAAKEPEKKPEFVRVYHGKYLEDLV